MSNNSEFYFMVTNYKAKALQPLLTRASWIIGSSQPLHSVFVLHSQNSTPSGCSQGRVPLAIARLHSCQNPLSCSFALNGSTPCSSCSSQADTGYALRSLALSWIFCIKRVFRFCFCAISTSSKIPPHSAKNPQSKSDN